MLASLEELTDGFYPEILFGNLIRNCTYSINGDGWSNILRGLLNLLNSQLVVFIHEVPSIHVGVST